MALLNLHTSFSIFGAKTAQAAYANKHHQLHNSSFMISCILHLLVHFHWKNFAKKDMEELFFFHRCRWNSLICSKPRTFLEVNGKEGLCPIIVSGCLLKSALGFWRQVKSWWPQIRNGPNPVFGQTPPPSPIPHPIVREAVGMGFLSCLDATSKRGAGSY